MDMEGSMERSTCTRFVLDPHTPKKLQRVTEKEYANPFSNKLSGMADGGRKV
jgi:hypothetical protein